VIRIAVLVSGRGSNLQAIIDSIEIIFAGADFRSNSDIADAYALERAERTE